LFEASLDIRCSSGGEKLIKAITINENKQIMIVVECISKGEKNINIKQSALEL
jgi:hypothetical protein